MKPEESEITLGLLNAVYINPQVTQRSVSMELGIALGLTNAYLKRCIKKGLIKVRQAPANRYAYYLTPRGISEKGRLTAEYLTQGFQFFRHARSDCSEIFSLCRERLWHGVVLHGLTDLTEIAVFCAANSNVKIVCIIDENTALESYSGIPIVKSIADAGPADAAVITDLDDPMTGLACLSPHFPPGAVFVPKILQSAPISFEQGRLKSNKEHMS